jgi:hypothetical protein
LIFSLDVRRARKGDCMLLHFGTKANPGLMVIDGGPADVYAPHLKPRLLRIREKRRLAAQAPLPLDIVMVSHVDDDHIRGILDLTRELRAATGAGLVQVQSLWHNSFDDIIGNDPGELTASVTAQFGAASVRGGLRPGAGSDLLPNGTDADQEIAESSLLVLASIAQGHALRGDAEALGWTLNAEHDGKLILADRNAVDLGNGLKLTVVGPMRKELQELQEKHDEWLEELKKRKKGNEAALAAYVDESVANLSSLVVLAECGRKRMLLTGDARGDKILQGLEETGLLAKGRTLHVELLKVPHHGSSNNLEEDFFRRITADHYVFSGDGEHGNPERESIEMLLKARGKKPFTLHLTYPVAEIDEGRKADWEMEQKKEEARKAKGGKKPVRENWSAAKHALAPVLKKRAKGQKLVIVGETKPHVIDLKTKLGY